MHVIINGETQELEPGLPLPLLLQRLGKQVEHVAIEHNGEILERAQIASTVLRESDRLEIVHFVGGG